MKYNLIPETIRQEQQRRRIQGWLRYIVPSAVVMILLSAVGGAWFQQKTAAERIYYTDQVYPYVKRIQKQNHEEELMKKQMDAVKTAEQGRIHWPLVLVCLAETKPPDGMVSLISVKNHHVVLEGQSASKEFSRAWQERLRHQPCIASVSIHKAQGKMKDDPVFRLEMEVQPDGTAAKEM
ncbi:MAG: hypothetical protein LKF47_04575 [Megasphaera sp.]|nr:hypothetical protein [Megasphaera sp.]MCI1248116.1 hypothetical protein [Megasphaera sp.]